MLVELSQKEIHGGMLLRLSYDTSFQEYHVTAEQGDRTVRRTFQANQKPNRGAISLSDRVTIQEVENDLVDRLVGEAA